MRAWRCIKAAISFCEAPRLQLHLGTHTPSPVRLASAHQIGSFEFCHVLPTNRFTSPVNLIFSQASASFRAGNCLASEGVFATPLRSRASAAMRLFLFVIELFAPALDLCCGGGHNAAARPPYSPNKRGCAVFF
jgi:hypothetical protein